jgi:NADPH-dependent glutamate synthase beta subunit-like oxidoreductase
MKSDKNRLYSVMVIGATPAGLAAANKLGELGVPVILIDSAADLDLKLADETYRLESGVTFNYAHRPGLIRILRNPGIRCLLPAAIRSVRHNSQGFQVHIDPQATFVDAERCTLCGQCVAICPVGAEPGAKPVHITSRQSLPGRAVIDKRREPLCQANCPLGVNAQGYVALAHAGRYTEALALIRQDNVLPAICGRVCIHPCEAACRRGERDAPVAIRDIKRYVADHAGPQPPEKSSMRTPRRAERIAVIGAGPAGLAAAVDLARAGFEVTIFEKQKEAGGLLRYGIGPHRLPHDILDRELIDIQAEGVKIVTNHPVSFTRDLSDLRKQFNAVVVTTGAWLDRRLGVKGETLAGVEGCISFLGKVHSGEVQHLDEKVAVIGDGNAAFDLARVLHRLGAEVTIVSWFSLGEIPAEAGEVCAALNEGIAIVERRQVAGFAGRDGCLNALRLRPTQPGEADAKGIAWPVAVPGSDAEELAFDRAFVAIGQSGPYQRENQGEDLCATERGYLAADGTGRTPIQGVYAAGDAVTGATSVVHAMADGRRAAASVIADIIGETGVEWIARRFRAVRPINRDFDPIAPDLPCQGRTIMPEIDIEGRTCNFTEVALGYDDDQLRTEASRCLQCGACSQCLECLKACAAVQAIKHDQLPEAITENVGVLIVADPALAPMVNGKDVIRAYGPPTARPEVSAMMLRGYAAAARAMVLLKKTDTQLKGQGITFVRPDPGLADTLRIGVFVCRCNDSLGWTQGMSDYLENLTTHSQIAHVEELTSACIPEGISAIQNSVREKGLTRIVLASCVCCPLNYVCSACTDQRSRLKNGLFSGTGISRSMVQTCNLRGEVLRLTRANPDMALTLFKGLIHRSIGRAAKLLPFPAPVRAYNFTTAVIGQSEAAWDSALTLGEVGLEVLMFGTAKQPLEKVPEHPNVFGFLGSAVSEVSGTIGDFKIHARLVDGERIFTVGGVILGEKSRNIALYRRNWDLPGQMVQSAMQKEQVLSIPFMYPGSTSISGLFLADPPGVQISKHTKGMAAAVLAAAAMPRSPRQSRGFSVVIDERLCRGCGRCLKVCPYQAVALKPNGSGMLAAVVDEALCKGCGNCISVCPTNAADSPFRDQAYLERTLEELLAGSERI